LNASTKWVANQMTADAIRWVARILSLASMALLAVFATSGGGTPSAREMVALAFFPLGVSIGFVIAWWREGLGGLTSVVSLALFYLWMGLMSGRALGPYFVLFSAPGFLFLASWLAHRLLNEGYGKPRA
jgi:hypothetical protein